MKHCNMYSFLGAVTSESGSKSPNSRSKKKVTRTKTKKKKTNTTNGICTVRKLKMLG